MKKFLSILFFAMFGILVFTVTGCGKAEELGVTDDQILIGTFQAMSGPLAVIGKPVADGMNAYFDYINQQGGINGRKIKLIIADDQFNPSKTVVEVKRMVESDKVFALVCGLGTPGNLAVMDYVNNKQVPFVYQAAGTSKLSMPPKKYIFPVQPNYVLEGDLMAQYLVNDVKAQRIAIIYRNADDGIEEYESLKKTMAKYGKELVAAIPINTSATDFSIEVAKLAEVNPDALVIMAWGGQSANIVKQAKQYGMNDTLYIMTYANADATFPYLAGEAAEGAEVFAWLDIDFTDMNFLPFIIYKQKFGNDAMPNAYAIAGMVAAEVFVEGIKRAGKNLTREKLVKALESMQGWSGLMADKITYKPFKADDYTCRLGKRSMYVLKIKDGVWVKYHDWIDYSEK